ncbi:hypothetical protein [Nocardia transvalensis]|uniref:hypothetical protein n=1 Tax=Nocardia transvalensis TaxID=37333 RepID=UPI0018940A61|nr:hypothetical protein [Nocardia transvalensis]MBF6332390.1 hypothetical protein [Nocardia transvalensis]
MRIVPQPLKLGRIVIDRVIRDDGSDAVAVSALDANGDDLPLIESLGMLAYGFLQLATDAALQDEDDEEL